MSEEQRGHLRARRRDRSGRPQPSRQAQLLQPGRDEGSCARRSSAPARRRSAASSSAMATISAPGSICAGRRKAGRPGARSGCRFSSTATPISRRWRAATSPSSRRCTARRWAAGSRRPRPRISASRTKPRSSPCPRERAASSSAAAARCAWRGCIGFARMQDMMLTGRVLKADEAERYGIVQYVVPKGEAMAKAKELAAKICKNAPLSNFAITNSLPRIQDMSLRRRPVLRTHGGGIHAQPGVDRAAAPVPRQDRAARARPE